MAKCEFCGTAILFGGVDDNGLKFCTPQCHQKGRLVMLSQQVPQNIVDEQVRKVHQGLCPKCNGNGPVDVHVSYRVYSALVMTRWSSHPAVSCASCGRRSQLGGAAFSLLLGWWGIPWGLVFTPVQIGRNIVEMFKERDPLKPSPQLEKAVRMVIAMQLMKQPDKPA